MEDEKLNKISENMKIFSIMEDLLENKFPMIIKKELEKNNIGKNLDVEITINFNLGE